MAFAISRQEFYKEITKWKTATNNICENPELSSIYTIAVGKIYEL